jgi:leucyl-tRNA---protein transferase
MINENFECIMVPPEDMDILWSYGFRHFGTFFFRYDKSIYQNSYCDVIPLRINLKKFKYSQSQKRILRRNTDIEVKVREASIDENKQRLFESHKMRFRENIPDSLYTFFSFDPSNIPSRAIEFDLYDIHTLIGIGYLDIGKTSTSSVYTFFDPSYGRRSLGILILLLQIRYSLENGKDYLYPGYAYKQPSFYDYKKNFYGLEFFNWKRDWQPMDRSYPVK